MKEPAPQPNIFSIQPELAQESLDLDTHVSLRRILTPDYHGLPADHFEGLSEEYAELFVPRLFTSHLIGQVAYEGSVRTQINGRQRRVTVLPSEYVPIVGSYEVLSKKAIKQTETARMLDKDRDAALAAIDRAGPNILKTARDKLIEQRDGYINPRLQKIEKFGSWAKYPNLPHGTEHTVRPHVNYLFQNVFGDMITTMAGQFKWTMPVQNGAVRSVEMQLLTGTPDRRIAMFRGYLYTLWQWHNERRRLINGKITKIQNYKEELEQRSGHAHAS